ncbi:P-loop containing nucleoside triphosphate hydrolase protein [Leptodontidium sp. 2 PMI_412]|nr:P-loop containing nucleoside triphosphate hydrolase protein [Leptodontidium sp. 2 PMI_412]
MNSFAKAHKVRSVSLGADVSLSYISFAGAQTYIAPNSSDSSSQGLSVFLASASTLFLLLSVVRIWKLRSNSIKVVSNHQNLVKIILSLLYLAVNLLCLLHVLIGAQNPRNISTVTASISLIAACSLCLLSFLEHTRSICPSTLIILYLLSSSVGHIIQLSIPAYQSQNVEIQGFRLAQVCLELAFLITECRSKSSFLKPQYQDLSPEETASVLGRTFFSWINPVLVKGNGKILNHADLPAVDGKLSSESLRKNILLAWDRRVRPESRSTLPLVLLRCLSTPFMAAILPRLSLIVFRYSQTVLISLTIRFVRRPGDDRGDGYWLVLAALTVYLGLAISTAVYQHRLNRLKVIIRGSLIGLIYHRSLEVESGKHEDGNAVTLLNTDVESIDSAGAMFHETWAQFLEVLIGTALLARQIGWLSPVPLFIIFLCSRMSRYVAKHLQSRQKAWNIATQRRLAMITSMLSSTKSMKMLGLTESMKSKITALRNEEIQTSKKLRWMMVAYNASANALGIFAPVVTLVLSAILVMNKYGRGLDTETVFTTTALLAMVTHPANMVMTIIPRAVASMANFERIQSYLLESSRNDQRLPLPSATDRPVSSVSSDHARLPAVLLENVTIQPNSKSNPILQGINLKIERGALVMCAGRVGTGKTTLAKAVLGEFRQSSGRVSISTKRVALCSQVPWLPSGSIKEVIRDSSTFLDENIQWYETVIDVCGLRMDIENLPDGDSTQIGSRGLNLSGGQRQRLALARAIYARCDVVVLDDPFSALDGKTEGHVVESLLGPQGILKKMGTTVFMVTNSSQYFHLADEVIVLGDSTIQTRGTWEELKGDLNQIAKIQMTEAETRQDIPSDRDMVKLKAQVRSTEDAAEDLTRKTGDFALYDYYFKSVGMSNVVLLMCFAALYSFFLTFSQFWLKWWTESRLNQTWFYMGGYLIIAFIAWLATSCQAWATDIVITTKSGAVLHDRLLSAIIGAPLSYFSETDIGVILNRFGQDIQLVDKQLPSALQSIFVQVFKLSMQAALLFSLQKILILTLPLCSAIVYVVQRLYLRTSRQLRFIELESRSAVYSSFLETVEGTATIRAFGWQREFEQENVRRMDESQKPFYILLCLQRWLNIVLDLIIAGIATCIIGLAVYLRGTTTGAEVGVALNLILVANSTLLKLVENWTSLEISLGAISRLRSTVSETPQEDKLWETSVPPASWPSSGLIEVENVTVSYNSNAVALRCISMKIPAGQKLLICGRTGSGKSTILLTLLHLLDCQNGSIKIDGIDISQVPRSILRQQCFITVPQDPFVFVDASLRFNIDASETLSDDIIIATLEKTHLWGHFSIHCKDQQDRDSPLHDVNDTYIKNLNPLDLQLSAFPILSSGQMQLLSLARAILRTQLETTYSDQISPSTSSAQPKRILLLDEATSSLDPETDSIMQDVIRKEFTERGHTVIAISHRLSVPSPGSSNAMAWIKEGRIERMGSLEDVMSSNNLGLED